MVFAVYCLLCRACVCASLVMTMYCTSGFAITDYRSHTRKYQLTSQPTLATFLTIKCFARYTWLYLGRIECHIIGTVIQSAIFCQAK